MLFEVSLPAEVSVGSKLDVLLPDGSICVVTVPPDVADGELVVEVPADVLCVTVPAGVGAGQTFQVESLEHGLLDVVCPDGVAEGDMIDLELPSASGKLCAFADPLQKETSMHVGSRCKVLRTSGSWTPATIVEHDECSDTFTLQLDSGGALKHCVESSDLAELDYTPDRCGEHYEGRCVQVRAYGALDPCETPGYGRLPSKIPHGQWEPAVVRAYDARTRTYTCELDRGGSNGGVRRGVLARDIRVRQRV